MFEPLRKWMAVMLVLVVTPGLVMAQEATFTGTVTGDDGETLPGANVVVEGLNIGVTTDIQGEYELNVPSQHVDGSEATLTASFVGFSPHSQTVTLSAGEQVVNFELSSDLLDLEELVVTGVVGETPRNKLAFTVDQISSEQLEQVPALNPASALQGKMAGVEVVSSGGRPGDSPSIRLRGSTSISGGQEPLIIVDGVITEGNLADIDANDIESMEVVKGAAAASLYGSRAANGVIQIFTKRGSNLAEGQTQVTLRNEFGMSFLGNQIDLAEHHPYMVNSQGQFINEDGEVLEFGQSRVLADPQRQHAVNPYPQVNDLQREMFDPGMFYTNHISIGRNTEGGNYQVSFSNTQEEGIIFGQQGFGRQNARVNIDQQIYSDLRLSLSGLYGQSNNDVLTEGPGSPFYGLLFFEPWVDLYADNPNGEPFYLHADPYSQETNPLYPIHFNDRTRDRVRVLGDARLNWNPIEWFTLEGNFSMDRQNYHFENFYPKGYLQEDGAAPLTPEEGPGSLLMQTYTETATNSGLTGIFSNAFGPVTSRLRLSYLYENSDYNFFSSSGSEFVVGNIRTLDGLVSGESIGSTTTQVRSEYLVGALQLDFYDRYIVDMLLRRDGSSLFGADERYQTYYRGSIAYRLTEDFAIPGFQEFKPRASIGTAGVTPGFSAQYETYSLAGGVPSKATIGNRELRPALATEQEYGLDMNFLDRFSASFTYSNTVTEDQILEVPLPATAGGYPSQWQNAGTLESTTYEASFGAVLMDTDNLRWTGDINFDRTRQYTRELDQPPFFIGPSEQGAEVFYVAPGEPFGVIYGNRWARSLDEIPGNLDPDNYMVNNQGYVVNRFTPDGDDAAGTIHESPVLAVDEDGETVMPIGDINADFNMGFSSTFQVGGFSLYGLLDWKQGGDVYNQTKQWIYREGRHGEFDQSNVAEGERKSTQYYSTFYNANNVSDYFVEDGSYLKLRELSVRYTFDQNALAGIGFGNWLERIRVGVVGRNLLTFTGYTGYDPEVAGVSGDATNYRFDGFGYPNFRTFTGNLEIVF